MACLPSDLTREQHDASAELLAMALTEAGYPTNPKWDGTRYINDPPVPDDALNKARLLVCQHMGLPYEFVED